jgi:hypothetical protein
MKRQVLIFVLSSLAMSCKFSEKEIYVIPNDYCGNVLIVTNAATGQAKKFDNNNSRVYEIPTSGVLVTSFQKEYGIVDKRFVRDSTIKDEIHVLHYEEDKSELDTTRVYAFYGKGFNLKDERSMNKIGIEVITISKPQQYDRFQNDAFIVWVFSSEATVAELTDVNFLERKKELDGVR